MRMSCNGCRVLRKGCSDDCSIRPCLQWIKSPESQANATVFLAKFYGRAGLMNLINAGPDHLRPAIFRSLLYEACGRIVNPIYGSVGLLWSGSWHLCQAAVEAVLKGAPIMQIPSETAASTPVPPLKAYDIRHISKDQHGSSAADHLLRVHKPTRFKRSSKSKRAAAQQPEPAQHESSGSHVTEPTTGDDYDSREHDESTMALSADDTVEASHVSQGEEPAAAEELSEVGLELTLGFEFSSSPPARVVRPVPVRPWDGDACHVSLGLELPAV